MDGTLKTPRQQVLQPNHLSTGPSNLTSLKKGEAVSINQLDSEQQHSLFNIQSMEVISTKQDLHGDEASLFDNKLYDRSMMENPSSDVMG